MPPRVLVDAAAVPADRGALIRYVDGLVAALDRAGADLAVVCQRADAARYAGLAPSARIVPGPHGITNRAARLTWEQTGLPFLARQVGAEVIHAPYYSIPLSSGLPTVATVHDLTCFTEPLQHDAVKAAFFRAATRTAVRHATRVIVPSKATRDELIRILSADPDPHRRRPTTASTRRCSTRRPSARSRTPPTGSACTAPRTWPSWARWSRVRTCQT
ncbi:glycosyltransferase [Streptosporangium vulgare]|uniref:glycosyltransferase n=1 Tax=Streptosporangium vulgare TaxID=46190 RepID=UPI0031D65758